MGIQLLKHDRRTWSTVVVQISIGGERFSSGWSLLTASFCRSFFPAQSRWVSRQTYTFLVAIFCVYMHARARFMWAGEVIADPLTVSRFFLRRRQSFPLFWEEFGRSEGSHISETGENASVY